MQELKSLAYKLREDAVRIIMTGGGGHIGGDMSIMEVLTDLYFKQMNVSPEMADDPNRDLFVMSKGHAMEALYAVLCEKGFLDLKEVTETFSKFGSPYIGHPNNKLPGIEMNSGSLGHGIPVAVGMALAAKMDERNTRVYVVTGDGELAEGSNWEGFMSGAMYKLDNLCCVIDRNRLQISGSTEDVMALDDLKGKLQSFNWHVISIDGNDLDAVDAAFEEAKSVKGKPTVIIANTTKGKGSAVMENKADWHHHLPNTEEYELIMKDLKATRVAIEAGKEHVNE